MELMYQLRFRRNGGCSYEYFTASPELAKSEACEVANSYLERHRKHLWGWAFKPPRTVSVVEYDRDTKSAKRNGERFKLRLQFVEMTYVGGLKKRDEWYISEVA